jgi:nitrogenase molybdenum-iron protein alpha/beta subunit
MYPGALLAQEACSYQAMTELLMAMRGSFAVVIHSDRDCSNVLPKTGGQVRSDGEYKFFCTNMREDEIVTGQGNAKLRRAIELVHEAYRPSLIVVLSTCPTVMIGDNIKNVARKAGRDLGIRVVAEVTHGLRPKSPAEIVDECYTMLIRGAERAGEVAPGRFNLVGMTFTDAERREVEAVCAALGLALNVVLSERSSIDDFLRVGNARFNVHPGPHLMLRFDEECRERFGLPAVEVPLPFGARASERFYRAIAEAAGVAESAFEAAVGPLREQASAAVDDGRARIAARVADMHARSPRLAYNIGSVRSFNLRRIALEELGELPFFEELGFAVRLFIQGPADQGNQERTAGVLAELGVAHPFVVFPDPGGLARFLVAGEHDLFFGAQFLRDQLSRVNLPLLQHHQLGMGFRLVGHDVALVEEALATRFYDHFRAEPAAAPPPPPLLPVLGARS